MDEGERERGRQGERERGRDERGREGQRKTESERIAYTREHTNTHTYIRTHT